MIQSRLLVIGGLVFQLRWTDILAMRRTFENAVCLDPRDRIYGVRALLHPDQQGLCGLPDYTISKEDLYQRTAQRFIEAYPDGLTILRHCELPNARRLQLRLCPSWVPDWSRKASSRWLHESRASSQIGGCFQFPRPGTLRVLGVSPVTICETQLMPKFDARDWDPGVCFLREAFDSSIEYLEYPTGGTCLRALGRSLLGGAVSDFMHMEGGNFPSTQIAEAVLARLVRGTDLDDHDSKMGSDAQRFFKRVASGSSGKKLIRGTNGYLGVGPPSTSEGDEIFVIVGCQQPLVLRRDSTDGAHYSVVGECYVEGCARGEPLLGNLPDHIGSSITESQTSPASRGYSRAFRDQSSGTLFREDPRLKNLGVNLGEFRACLGEDPEAMLNVAPEVLLGCIEGLRYVDIV